MKKIYLFFAAMMVAFSASAIDVPASAGKFLKLLDDGVVQNGDSYAKGFTLEDGYVTIEYPGTDLLICSNGATFPDFTVSGSVGFVTMIVRLNDTSDGLATDIEFGLGENATVGNKKSWAEWAAMSGSVMTDPAKGEWQVQIFKLDPAFAHTDWFRVMIAQWAGRDGLEISDIFISENAPDFGTVVTPVNKDDLAAKLAEIAATLEFTNETELLALADDYTTTSFGAFLLALAAANEAFEDAEATQGEVNAALTALEAAYTGLKPAGSLDTEDLEDAIAAAEDLNEGDYTAECWAALQAVLDDAKEALTATTQSEIDAAATALMTALDDMEDCAILGINDLAADGSAVTGYFSILGAKLSEEPASGVFIVKYANGTAVKVVK